MKIALYQGLYGGGYTFGPETESSIPDRSRTVLTDYDFPGLAQSFGMVLRHKPKCEDRGSTDGTIPCLVCNTPVSTFIQQARTYLDNHIGKVVDDPGYFS